MIRILIPFGLLLLFACGDGGNGTNQAAPAETASSASAEDGAERIECAIASSPTFERNCVVERAASGEGLTLTIRAPTGSFRRLLVTKDGRGVIAADGAEPAQVTPLGPDRIEVAISGDRYRLPATVRQ